MPTKNQAKLISKKSLGANTSEFTFALNSATPWHVGQFAMIAIQDGQTPVIKRAYSIASSPSNTPKIVFLIKKVDGGRGTRWLFDELNEGDCTEIMLPFGHMKLDEKSKNEILLIGTGIGIAPMLSFVDSLAEKGFPVTTRLFYGVRHENEFCYLEKLEQMSKEYENFHFYPTVSRPQDNWKGNVGRVDALLNRLPVDFSQQSAYICGSPEVAKSLESLLIGKGVLKENVGIEAF